MPEGEQHVSLAGTQRLASAVRTVSDLLQRLAGIMLLGMMLLTCLDVLGNVVGLPIMGSEELVSLMAALLLGFVLPAAHWNKAHIGIDVLYRHLSPRLKRINDIFISAASGIFFLLVSWQCWLYGLELRQTGEVSSTLQLPTYFILFALSIACFILFLIIMLELVQRLQG